jgi:hypothetical protein
MRTPTRIFAVLVIADISFVRLAGRCPVRPSLHRTEVRLGKIVYRTAEAVKELCSVDQGFLFNVLRPIEARGSLSATRCSRSLRCTTEIAVPANLAALKILDCAM